MVQPTNDELSLFQSPPNLHAKVTPESLQIPDHIFFRDSDPKYQKYREAFAASLLARGISAYVQPCEVRLCLEKDFPDFEIRIQATAYEFEFTEVQESGRKRGDEYKKQVSDPTRSKEVAFADIPEAAQWICEGIKRKANKSYGTKVHLLVYANFQVAENLDLRSIRERCAKYKQSFKSIWVLFAITIAQIFHSDDFGDVCAAWSEIPGYLKESQKRMGIRDA